MADKDRGLKEDAFQVLRNQYPQHAAIINQLEKLSIQAQKALDAAAPYLSKAATAVEGALAKAHQMQLDELTPMLLGLAVCFFGGYFAMCITVLETLRLLCWEDLRQSYNTLKENYDIAAAASAKDDTVDADGNGIADVEEMKPADRLRHKLTLFAKSVDIPQVQQALRVLASAALSVTATLRVKMARALTLAGSLADTVRDSYPIEERLREALPENRKKFASIITTAALNSVAFILALLFSTFITTVHCSIRGSYVFARSALSLARKRNLVPAELTMESDKGHILVAVVAALGVFWQLAHHSGLPFPLNVLLFPLTMTEWILQCAVSVLMAAPVPASA